MEALRRQRYEDQAAVIGPLGDERRMLERAAETGNEILSGGHAVSPGLWCSCQWRAIWIRCGIQTFSWLSTYSTKRRSAATRPGRPTRRQCSPTDIIFGAPSLPSW